MRRLKVTMDEQIAALAVAEKGSFETAGKYLGIGKSAVRKRVHSIDNELGTPVFHSVGRSVVPTEAGNLYLPLARESVRHALLGVDRVKTFLKMQSKELRIAYCTDLNTKLLDMIRRIQPADVQATSITRESLPNSQVIAGVLQGEFHVGFGILPVSDHDLSAHVLLEEPLVVCLPQGHRLVAKPTLRLEDMEDVPVVSVFRKELPGTHAEIVSHFESHGISLKFVADSYSVREALWLVKQGICVAIMTKFLASSYRHDLALRPFSDWLLAVRSGIFALRDYDQKVIQNIFDSTWVESSSLRRSFT